MKVHLLHNPEKPHSSRHRNNFLYGAKLARNSPHELVESPDAADLILVFDPEDDPFSSWLRKHPVINSFSEKCFSYSELDRPYPFLPGIHVSASKHGLFRERIQTYAYISYGPAERLRNPYVTYESSTPKRYLFSFMGRATHRCRVQMLNQQYDRKDVFLQNPNYQHWDSAPDSNHREQQRRYAEIAKASCFALCPRGDGLASIRLFEMMEMGICPVIISDGWLLPEGPDWNAFAIFVNESQVDRLEAILEPLKRDAVQRGQNARKAWLEWFAPERQFDRMVEIMTELKARRRLPETQVRLLYRAALVHPILRAIKVQLGVFLDKAGLKKIQ